MKPLRVAVLGASGIGKFHAREFARYGQEVVAILGSTDESAQRAALELKEFGIYPTPYSKLSDLLLHENIDAVSICTPSRLHYEMSKQCLFSGVHVLCEKPFIEESGYENVKKAEELTLLAEGSSLVLSVNTQWPSVLRYCSPYVNVSEVKEFYMHTQPESVGCAMLQEQLSHSNSMLVRLIPHGVPRNIRFETLSPEEIHVYFEYVYNASFCHVHYYFKHKGSRPRDVVFSINNVSFARKISEQYQQTFVTGSSVIAVQDPLAASISSFVNAVKKIGNPLISLSEIVENMSLQDLIIKEYILQEQKTSIVV
jgi:hypothetical protein